MNDDLWEHLEKSGITKCDKNNDVEIDMHEEVKTARSFYFDCLRLNDDSEFSQVYISVDRNGRCEVVFAEVVFASGYSELGTNAIIEELRTKLNVALRSFIKDKVDLA